MNITDEMSILEIIKARHEISRKPSVEITPQDYNVIRYYSENVLSRYHMMKAKYTGITDAQHVLNHLKAIDTDKVIRFWAHATAMREYNEYCQAVDEAKFDHIAECAEFSICPECGDKVIDGECTAYMQELMEQYRKNEAEYSI